MAAVIFEASSGSLLDEARIGNETLGIFQPSGLAKTPDGDFIVFDEQNEPSHLKGETIVRFKPGVLKTSFIDNMDLRYGLAGEVFQDKDCLGTMAEVLSANDLGNWVVAKIHRNMTTADSLATTRLSKVIKVPDFYNTIVLMAPKEYGAIEGEYAISDSLESADLLCCIRYAEVNRVVTLDDCEPNDPLYETQGNLHPNEEYTDGHINMEPAWCIAGGGSSNVKVAIIDSGIRWSHEDFGDGTFSGSVIVDGKDYGTGAHISTDNNNDSFDHGTRVASVIGSIRNNAIGVAGIAGGSGSADGVRLIAQKAVYPGLEMSIDKLIEAFGDAVDEYSVHVINCSGGYNDPIYSLSDYDIALREKLHHANRMGVIICASRGNSLSGEPENTPRNPATAQDEWVLCVGGTGTDGNYNPECRFGGPMDIAAPSRWQLTRSAQNYITGTSQASDQAYGGISFTSGATPHAAGLAALMVGYYESTGTPLVQEDIEYIIQASATDVGDFGYDAETGYGRINAGVALQMIEQPMCNVYHFGTDVNPHSRIQQLVGENVIIELDEPFTTEEGQVFDKGIYSADVYKVTATVTHPLPANAQLNHFWARHSSSTVFKLYGTSGGQNVLRPVEHATVIGTPTQSIAVLEGYVYYLKNSSCSIEGWIPASPENAQLTYSVIGCLTTGTEEAAANMLNLFPNPASGQISVSLPQGARWDNFDGLSILDFSGRQVISAKGIEQASSNPTITLDVGHLPSGFYTCVVRWQGHTFSTKFMKL